MSTVLKRIVAFNKDRVPEMFARKMEAMQSNVFSFFRGTCHLFAEDYRSGFTYKDNSHLWLCGDLHFENFGTYKDLERKVYFDINDFDEAALGPVSFDLIRLITSFYVAASQFKLAEKKVSLLAGELYGSYIKILQKGKPLNGYKAIRSGMITQLINRVKKRKQEEILNKYVQPGKNPLLKSVAGHTMPVEKKINDGLKKRVNKWAKKKQLSYIVLDVAFRIAGTGSLGVRHYIALLQNPVSKKLALLDIKEVEPSCLIPFLTGKQPKWKNQALRVIKAQKNIQFMPPKLLKAMSFEKTWYYLKFLQPVQDKIDISQPGNKLKMLEDAAVDLGEIVASGQLRCCGFNGADSINQLKQHILKNEEFKTAVLKYALNYSKQVDKDYAEFCKAMKKHSPLTNNKPQRRR